MIIAFVQPIKNNHVVWWSTPHDRTFNPDYRHVGITMDEASIADMIEMKLAIKDDCQEWEIDPLNYRYYVKEIFGTERDRMLQDFESMGWAY